jgi:hypothetical protein
LGEEYRSLSSSLCSFLHPPPIASSLLSPNVIFHLHSQTPSVYVIPSNILNQTAINYCQSKLLHL